MNRTVTKALILGLVITARSHAATIDGTVNNKTTGRPSAGDKVALVDLSAGMADAATAITNTEGKYTLQASGTGSYLIRVDHQGAGYFIAAPQSGSPADVTVYDVATQVGGVGIDADMLLIEAGQGTLHVRERYLVRNASLPPRTQFSDNTFEVVLPDGAQLEEAAATRPGGMGTRTHLIPREQKGHYSFNVPIQPNQGEKETIFEVSYHFPYSGRHSFTVHPIAPVDHFVVYTAQGIKFSAKESPRFKNAPEDPRVDTHVAMNIQPGEDIAFDISGDGLMPANADSATMQLSSAASPGIPGGSGASTASRDPLTGSTGWLFAGTGAILAGIFVLVLRRREQAKMADVHEAPELTRGPEPERTPPAIPSLQVTRPEARSLLDAVKEELFALEQDKISDRVSPEEYERARAGLEAVLKRALNSQSQQ